VLNEEPVLIGVRGKRRAGSRGREVRRSYENPEFATFLDGGCESADVHGQSGRRRGRVGLQAPGKSCKMKKRDRRGKVWRV